MSKDTLEMFEGYIAKYDYLILTEHIVDAKNLLKLITKEFSKYNLPNINETKVH